MPDWPQTASEMMDAQSGQRRDFYGLHTRPFGHGTVQPRVTSCQPSHATTFPNESLRSAQILVMAVYGERLLVILLVRPDRPRAVRGQQARWLSCFNPLKRQSMSSNWVWHVACRT